MENFLINLCGILFFAVWFLLGIALIFVGICALVHGIIVGGIILLFAGLVVLGPLFSSGKHDHYNRPGD